MDRRSVLRFLLALTLGVSVAATWTEDTSVGGAKQWQLITSSSDGTKLAATVLGGIRSKLVLFSVCSLLSFCDSAVAQDVIAGQTWELSKRFTGVDEDDDLGLHLVLSENGQRLAIGEHYYVSVLDWSATSETWVQVGESLTTSDIGSTISSVHLSGDGNTLAVASYYVNSRSGRVKVFELELTADGIVAWIQLGPSLDGWSDAQFGNSVSLAHDGLTIAVGSKPISDDEGYVSVYKYADSQWTNSIHYAGAGDGTFFPTAGVLSGNGDRFVAFKDDNSFSQGTVLTYHSPSETWSYVDSITVDGEAAISKDGNTIVGNYGKVYRYNSLSETFDSTRQSNTYAVGSGGVSVSSDGSRVAMGDMRFGTEQKGRVLLEQWNTDINEWETLMVVNGDEPDDWCGYKVSLSGTGKRVAVFSLINWQTPGRIPHTRIFDEIPAAPPPSSSAPSPPPPEALVLADDESSAWRVSVLTALVVSLLSLP
jgi:hypothetical protein